MFWRIAEGEKSQGPDALGFDIDCLAAFFLWNPLGAAALCISALDLYFVGFRIPPAPLGRYVRLRKGLVESAERTSGFEITLGTRDTINHADSLGFLF
jgi:hypothetical protein